MEQNPESFPSESQRMELLKKARILQRVTREQIDRFMDERGICNLEMEILSRSKELKEHEASIERDRRLLEAEKAKNRKRSEELEKAIELQKLADINLLNVFKDQEREKKESLRQVTELKRASSLDEMTKKYKELKEGFDELDGLYKQLIVLERRSNDNYQEARKALIEGLVDVKSSNRANIGIKRMGEIDEKVFKNVCKLRFRPKEAETKATQLCSTWQEKLRNPEWHPFLIVDDKSVINEDDEALQSLKKEWGDEIHGAVKTALLELQEYNASGCYPVSELWNFKENRKATFKEVIDHILARRDTNKRQKSCKSCA